ncbi:hypothetical protein Droror1_Dr00004151 [Drosera rotundifolia]
MDSWKYLSVEKNMLFEEVDCAVDGLGRYRSKVVGMGYLESGCPVRLGEASRGDLTRLGAISDKVSWIHVKVGSRCSLLASYGDDCWWIPVSTLKYEAVRRWPKLSCVVAVAADCLEFGVVQEFGICSCEDVARGVPFRVDVLFCAKSGLRGKVSRSRWLSCFSCWSRSRAASRAEGMKEHHWNTERLHWVVVAVVWWGNWFAE